jgi:hypothetical protein
MGRGAPFGLHNTCYRTLDVLFFAPTTNGLFRREYDFRMEEGSGYSGGYGYQFALAVEDFDLTGAGEFGEVDGASGADAGSGGFVGGDRGELRQELAGVDEEGSYAFVERGSRFLHSASLSLRESEAPAGMTIFCLCFLHLWIRYSCLL